MSRLDESRAWKSWGTPPLGGDLRVWQAGRCAWCGDDRASRLVMDHCHMTGLVRGFLCDGCNVREGLSFHADWEEWREGANPAAAMRFVEVYVGWGGTPISPQSALTYYSHAERIAYWESLPGLLSDPDIPWPSEAPWTDSATERRDAEWGYVRSVMNWRGGSMGVIA